MNVPLFLSAFHLHEHRMNLQPALVYSVLSLSTFLKSSNLEDGILGRKKALILRTMAQMSLEQSINCNYITPGLAQAALILVLFEVCCHPEHSAYRANSMLQTLDSLIRTLGFLDMDINDPQLTRFRDHTGVVGTSLMARTRGSTSPPGLRVGNAGMGVGGSISGVGSSTLDGGGGCSCTLFKISSTNPTSAKTTPFWLATPGWNSSWTLAETRFEEQRRLVWSAMTLAAAHVSYSNSLGLPPLDLAITKPWMINVLFPGETLYRGSNPKLSYDILPGDPSPKDSVWALYARSQLLFASAAHVKYSDRLSEKDKAEFAVRAWLETERIEAQLDVHTCDVEKATIYHGREYLFNTQNLVSSQFTSHVPHPYLGDGSFHRAKAVNWLNHQRHVANFLFGRLEMITGLHHNLLAKRPYFIFWFFGQVARYLNIWQQDNTLIMALDLAKTLLPPMEYLMSIYPSERE
ncbi:hypothetical protein DL93DRAFT_2054507 [Clavulina sp. PMI_390]|nr:hypothetical protein DL93DRAFT_2054507 [Clavulina sp. PMI_390]